MKSFFSRNFLARKSFFLRFLRSYLIVLLIPFAAITIMYSNAQKTLQEETLSSNANRLNQFVNIIDIELGNMIEKASQILGSGILRKQVLYHSALSQPSSAYEIYEVKKYLDDLPMDDFSDIFVYLPRHDRIISAEKSSLSSREYYDTYYQTAYNKLLDTENNYDIFYHSLNPNTLVPHLISFGLEQTAPSLGVVLAANYSNVKKTGDVTAVLVLRPELLDTLIDNAMYHNEGSILIYNNQNQLLVSTEKEKLNIDLSKYTGNHDNIYYDTIDGEDYILQLFESHVLDCTYVSLISSRTFWEKLNGMRAISIFSILLSMLVSILLSWMLARRSYLPIYSIVHTLRNKSDMPYDLKKKSELDYIKEVVINTFTENDMLSHRIKNSKDNLFEEFLLHAMQGTLSNNKSFEREMEQLNQNFISNAFCILMVRIDSVNEKITGPLGSSDGQRILSLIVGNVMQELCAVSHRGFIISLMSNAYAVVFNFSPDTPSGSRTEDALEAGHAFQHFIREYFEITSTISISNPAEGIENISISYRQALQAMEYRYLMGKGSIIPYQDITAKKFSYNNAFNSKNSMILIHYVKDNTEEDISELIREIIRNSSIDSNSSLSVIECFKYDLINTINKIIFEIGAVDLEKKNNYISRLIQSETFEEFQEALKACLTSLKKYREEHNEQFTICDKAEELIHKCYMDANLNNSIIADKLDITPSYLSKMFRTEKNISLLDYLNQVRLSYAKKYLRETNLTVEEIASKTGFISDSALIKAFKKYEGVTPGSYRRIML
ncbi:AraC-like DNA-binding protein [Anaerotaenia torta]|uniref:helix-turn-helix domain-containing protein n=1 Tax=Anaerotaenia torta TaxID=433293 RepID=UPI003D1915E7